MNERCAGGRKKIEDSASYLIRIETGYRSLLTPTFTPEWRAQIEIWDQMQRGYKERFTIGKLETRFLNTL